MKRMSTFLLVSSALVIGSSQVFASSTTNGQIQVNDKLNGAVTYTLNQKDSDNDVSVSNDGGSVYSIQLNRNCKKSGSGWKQHASIDFYYSNTLKYGIAKEYKFKNVKIAHINIGCGSSAGKKTMQMKCIKSKVNKNSINDNRLKVKCEDGAGHKKATLTIRAQNENNLTFSGTGPHADVK